MNAKAAKKLRKIMKRNWKGYLKDIKGLSFWHRWSLCWWIMFGDPKKVD